MCCALYQYSKIQCSRSSLSMRISQRVCCLGCFAAADAVLASARDHVTSPQAPTHGERLHRQQLCNTTRLTTAMARSTDPAKLPQTVSPRRSAGLQRFAYNPGPAAAADSDGDSDTDGSLSSVDTVDIEDIMDDGPPTKRRKGAATAKVPPKPPQTRPRRMPAAPKQKQPKRAGSEHKPPAQAPPNWELMYDIVKEMREMNPTAPVDTMGCAELYSRSSSARDRRFHILTALMLSSQTKDTVTAVAMQRLHTELGGEVKKEEEDEDEDNEVKKEQQPNEDQPSTLTLENILEVSPTRLNTLIQTVGFHNNKTKYIKATATILASQYDGDIPSTAPELMKLPGVGPKMAYLCMSAAWDKHDGIGVDVHVHRITNLWGWNHTRNPEETREALQSWLPREKWHEINKLLVGLGQTVCLPVKRRCGECALAGKALCRSELKK